MNPQGLPNPAFPLLSNLVSHSVLRVRLLLALGAANPRYAQRQGVNCAAAPLNSACLIRGRGGSTIPSRRRYRHAAPPAIVVTVCPNLSEYMPLLLQAIPASAL